jgi:glycosyltransferase involved in cell wall biosynthesis
MRVLHVSPYYAPAFVYGGPPRSIHGLCRALTHHGVEVEVFTTDANGAGALPAAVTRARQFDGVRVRYFRRAWPLWPIGSRELVAAMRRATSTFDLVHIHGLWNRVVWAAAREAQRARVPFVVSPRGMLEDATVAHHGWRKRLAYAAFERHTLNGAALFHATSPREADTIRLVCPGADVVLIPNGITVPPAVTPLRDGPPVLAFVGRLHVIKRVDLLLDAFALVRAVRADARLIIAGPDEQGLRASLDSRHGFGDAVSWVGVVDDAARDVVLAPARALVMCSDSESFGMAVVEAMAAGRPVVVTRTAGWPGIDARGAGFRVDQTAPAIAGALLRLIDDRRMAAAMGQRGRDWVQQDFTWPAVAGSFVDAYADVARTHVTVSR